MKEYPSIPGPSKSPHDFGYIFLKYDGSSIRSEFNFKKGFYKWGTRTQLLDTTNPILGYAIPIFMQKYADSLENIFKKEKLFRGAQNITIFFEFFGEGSFAGQHLPDKQYDVVLFDVNIHKKGIMSPKEFLDYFGHLPVAEFVGTGNLNQELINDVRNGNIDLYSRYQIKTRMPEGVVIKGGSLHKLWMSKIKTNAYLEELKSVYADKWQQFWE